MYKDISILEHIVKYCNMVEHSVERFCADYNTFMNDEDYKNSVSMRKMISHTNYCTPWYIFM